MLTGQSEGGRPITDLGALPGMCGHSSGEEGFAAEGLLEKTQQGPVWLSYSSVLGGRRSPAPGVPAPQVSPKNAQFPAAVKMGGEGLTCQSWLRESWKYCLSC